MEPEQRPLHHRIARRFDAVQDVYEARKNADRSSFLKSVLPKGGVGAELGVHKGHLTPHLIEWSEAKKVYAVDPWYLLEPEWAWAAGNKSTVNGLIKTLKRTEKYLQDGRAEVVIADDCEWLAGLPDGFLDWVYLDSSHMYEHTVREMQLLVRKVKVGGIIAGDDWHTNPTHRHHGVAKGATEVSEETGRAVMLNLNLRTQQWAMLVRDPAEADLPGSRRPAASHG